MADFDPVSLFALGEQGVIYDVQDLTSMFQNSNGTTAAVVDSPVGYLADKSGNGNHAIQATAGSRPTLRFGNGAYYLDFDGVDDFLRATFTIAQPWTRVSLLDTRTYVENTRLFGAVNGYSRGELAKGNGGANALLMGAVQLTSPGDYRLAEQHPGLILEVHDGASSQFAFNQDVPVTGDVGAAVPGGITLGAAWEDNVPGTMRLYGLVEIDRTLTSVEKEDVDWFLTRAWARVLVVDGDSNSFAPALTARSFAYQFMANANPSVFLQNIAISGTGLDTNVEDLAFASRATQIDRRIPADKRGRQYVYFPWWSNNLSADTHVSEPLGPGEATAASFAGRVAIFLAARKAAGWDKVGIGTVCERTDAGQDNTAVRAGYNAIISAPGWIEANDIDFLADFAADPVIGAVGASLDTDLMPDGVHLTALAHGYAEVVFRAALNALPLESGGVVARVRAHTFTAPSWAAPNWAAVNFR